MVWYCMVWYATVWYIMVWYHWYGMVVMVQCVHQTNTSFVFLIDCREINEFEPKFQKL